MKIISFCSSFKNKTTTESTVIHKAWISSDHAEQSACKENESFRTKWFIVCSNIRMSVCPLSNGKIQGGKRVWGAEYEPGFGNGLVQTG